jgi:drug/metabolite transporter (DMT)-like permease
LNSGQLNGGQLDSGRLNSGQLNGGQLDGGQLDSGQLDGGQLNGGWLTSAPLLYALLALMIVGWAANYIAGKIALQSLPAVLLYGVRISMAAALMLPVYLWDRRRHTPTWTLRDLPLMVGIGIFGVSLNQFLFVVGLSRTSVAHAAIFANLSPFLVLLLAAASGLEKLTLRKVVGVVVALAGVVLLRVADSGPAGASTFLGDFLTFLGSLAFAIFTVVGKPTAKRMGSIAVNTVAYIGGAILMAPVTIWQAARFPLATVPWQAWLSVFYMALGPSVICYLIYYNALAHMEASRLSAVNYFLPVMATLLGVWTLGESITMWTAVAGIVIFGGVYVVERAQ